MNDIPTQTSTDLLIIGQGIAGSMLAWFALKNDMSVKILDPHSYRNASSVSSGIINPVTGPKYVKSWRIDEFLPKAKDTYQSIQELFGEKIVHEMKIWRHLKNVKEENVWEGRLLDPFYENHLENVVDQDRIAQYFNAINRFGAVSQSLRIDVDGLINLLREQWQKQNIFEMTAFDPKELLLEEGYVVYEGKTYQNIVLATGHHLMAKEWFDIEDFRPVKGEVLIAKSNDFPQDVMVKNGKFIVPMGNDHFWIGSNYQHDYKDAQPDKKQAKPLYEFLENEVNVPFHVVNHISGIRPATRFRRPIIRTHEVYNQLHQFNGLGTKGISLAPALAEAFILNLKHSN